MKASSLLLAAPAVLASGLEQHASPPPNSNHIFNAIHSNMRQWGSSVHHNGMSFFITSVPKDTELYHGRATGDPVNGTEWLAFEPEHALGFARMRPGRGRGPGGPGGPPGGDRGDRGPPPPVSVAGDVSEDRRQHGRDHGDHGPSVSAKGEVKGDRQHHGRDHDDDGPSANAKGKGDRRDHGRNHDDDAFSAKGEKNDDRRHHGRGQGDDGISAKGEKSDDRRHHGRDHGDDVPSARREKNGDRRHHGRDHGDDSMSAKGGEKGDRRHHGRDHGEDDSSVKVKDTEDRHQHQGRPGTDKPSSDLRRRQSEQEPMIEAAKPKVAADDELAGYLHTYRTKHDLRLLYIDGEAGAKSTKGTLDSQDIILVPNKPERVGDPSTDTGGPMGETERAKGLCNLARDEWKGRVDGFLRMEAGFEIILCDFERDLSVVSIIRAGGGGGRHGGPGFDQYWHAVASRYDDIGGNRAHSDTDDFVTALAFPDAVAFDDQGFPRATNESSATSALRTAIRDRVLRADSSPGPDWRGVADMVVARYADRLESLASGSHASLAELQAEAAQTLTVFIDFANRDPAAEKRRCAAQLLPSSTLGASKSGPPPLAYQAVHNITSTVCAALVDVASAEDLPSATATFRQLKTWLNWSVFKRCAGCEYDEICFLPIWPSGGQEDYDHPTCRRDMGGAGRGYWGGFH